MLLPKSLQLFCNSRSVSSNQHHNQLNSSNAVISYSDDKNLDGFADLGAVLRRKAFAHSAHVHAQIIDRAGDVVVYGVDLALSVSTNLELQLRNLYHGARSLVANPPQILSRCDAQRLDEHAALCERGERLQAEHELPFSKGAVVLNLGFNVG